MQSPTIARVFNREAFIDRMTGDDEFARTIAGTFAERLPRMLCELRESVAVKSNDRFHAVVHKIKGSSANVGGEALASLAHQIEQSEAHHDLSKLIADLELQADLLINALQAWTSSHP